MERSDHQVERGLVSILHYLATIGGDLPDHLVKHYMMAAHEQPSTSVDRTVAYFRRQA
ncbi:MAG: hypothetical protein HZY74_05515 [Brevundimonas sp.]|nr:MAG: hypothetical protein HZY74_05515 [Brevundimonas sp.]